MIVPVPVPPAVLSVTVGVAVERLKVAVTAALALTVNVQVDPVPEQAPLQFARVLGGLPAAGAAVSVTDVPTGTVIVHVVPQVRPAGFEVTVPLPVPDFATVTVAVGAGGGVPPPPPSPPPHAASNIAAPNISTEVIFPDCIGTSLHLLVRTPSPARHLS